MGFPFQNWSLYVHQFSSFIAGLFRATTVTKTVCWNRLCFSAAGEHMGAGSTTKVIADIMPIILDNCVTVHLPSFGRLS